MWMIHDQLTKEVIYPHHISLLVMAMSSNKNKSSSMTD